MVKVVSDDQDEHLALAPLRHTHIVPLFSEHSFPSRGLRALCMPDLGGVSLARVLDDLAGIPLAGRTGAIVVAALDRGARPAPAGAPTTADPEVARDETRKRRRYTDRPR